MSYIKYGEFNFLGESGYPVPQISISNEQERNGAGRIIGSKTIVNLEGLIYANSTGTGGFEYLVGKESGLRNAFQKDGELLQIGCTGVKPLVYLSGNPRVNRYSADKTDNHWLNTIAYNIELQIDNTGNSASGIFAVSSTQDEMNIETIDEFSYVSSPYDGIRGILNLQTPFSGYPIYRISRTLSAVGKYIPNGKNPISNAKDWVMYHASQNMLTGYLSGLSLYNFTRSVSVNEPDGSYRITDNWLATNGFSGSYTESFNAESALDNTMLRTVVINGTIKGLETFNSGNNGNLYSGLLGTGVSGYSLYPTYSGSRSGNSRFSNALIGYSGVKNNLFNRANAFLEPSGYTSGVGLRFFGRNEPPLNPIPVSVTEGYNPSEGSVTYSWTYNNRPLNIISGSISEVLTINDTLPTQSIAELFVLGRRLGPVLQDLGTYTASNRDVTFEVVMPRPSSLSGFKFPINAYRAITGLVESFNPTFLLNNSANNTINTIKFFVKNDTENWIISEGRFVKSKAWTWTKCF